MLLSMRLDVSLEVVCHDVSLTSILTYDVVMHTAVVCIRTVS